MRLLLFVFDKYRLLLTGGRCSEVVIKSGLTVHTLLIYKSVIWDFRLRLSLKYSKEKLTYKRGKRILNQ
jgi:hypothetical protein